MANNNCIPTVEQFQGFFQSAANGGVAGGPKQGVPLRQLLGAQLAAFAKQVDIDRTEVILRHGAVLGFATLINELAVNAVRHGALSVPAGRVSIRWTIEKNDHPATLRFRWEETGGPSVVSPMRVELDRMIIAEMAKGPGKFRSDYSSDALKFELELLLDDAGWIRELSF